MEKTLNPQGVYGDYLELKFRKLEEFLQLTERLKETVEKDDIDGAVEHLENRDRCIREIDRIDGMINDLLYRGKRPDRSQVVPSGFRGIMEQMASMGQKALELNRHIESRMSSGCEGLKTRILSLLTGGGGKKMAGTYRTGGEPSSRFLDVKG